MTTFGGRFRADAILHEAAGLQSFRGLDEKTNTPVVIKALKASALARGGEARFRRAAESLALDGFGEESGRLWTARGWIAGETLEERLRRGRLPLEEALAVARAVLEALRELHARGVLHRNLKPHNVIGHALVDPALLRRADHAEDRSAEHVLHLSPEQAGLIDAPADARSDLYAAGLLLFECLAGKPPFIAANIAELLRRQATQAPPMLRELGLAVPRAVDELVQRLLRKDPAARPQSARAALAELDGGEPGAFDLRRTLTDPCFAGRERELKACLDATGLCVVEGGPESGKTRLLDEVAYEAAARGVRVVRCRAQASLQAPLALVETVSGAGLVLVDDAHCADALSLDWLAQAGVAVIAAAPPGAILPGAPRVALEPLDESEARRLAVSMAGPLPAECIEALVAASHGNPASVEALLHGLVESGALAATDEGWQLAPDFRARLQSSRRAGERLVARLASLSDRDALRACAVLGVEFSPAQAAALAERAVDDAIAAAERGGVIFEAQPGRYRFLHERIRTALLEGAPRELYLRAAALATNPWELAAHFDAAGDARALAPALEAAAESARKGAWDVAERCWRIAQRHAPHDERVAEGLAEALAQRGEHAAALETLRTLQPRSAEDKARVAAAIGELQLELGDASAALSTVEAALPPVPRFGRSALDAGAARLLRTQARAQEALGRERAAAATRTRALHLLERAGPSPALALALCDAAEDALRTPSRAMALVDKAFAAARDDEAATAACQLTHARVRLAMGDWPAALGAARTAASHRGRDAPLARALAARCLFAMGDVGAAAQEARGAAHGPAALEALDVSAMCGAFPKPPPQPRTPREKKLAAHIQALARIADGAPAEAAKLAEPYDDAALKAVHAAALRLEAARLPQSAGPLRDELLATAQRSVDRGLALASPEHRARLLRESALVAVALGDARTARRRFEDAIREAEATGQLAERDESRRARAETGALLGWPGAAEQLAEVSRTPPQLRRVSSIEASLFGPETTSVSLFERFSSVLELGRAIASSLTRDDAFRSLRAAALQLLRAEKCRIAEVTASGELVPLAGDDELAISRTLAQRAVETRRPATIERALPDAWTTSLTGAGVRSALCAPVVVRGRVAACFYVTHRQVGGLFGDDEERLAQFLATLAGAALENAEGLEEVRALSRTLEKRVDDRTAELRAANRQLETSLRELRAAESALAAKVRELTETRDALVQSEKLAVAGRLAAGVAHEINNPLAFVLSNLEVLAETTGDRLAQDSLEGARRIAELVDSFRALGEGPGAAAPEAVDVETLLDECMPGVTRERGALPLAAVAREDLRTAVAHVAEFLRERARELVVRTGASEGHPEIRIGAPALRLTDDDRAHVFDPRIDVAEGTARRMRLDVGLPLAYQLLRRNGGELSLAREGEGTVFHLRLRAHA